MLDDNEWTSSPAKYGKPQLWTFNVLNWQRVPHWWYSTTSYHQILSIFASYFRKGLLFIIFPGWKKFNLFHYYYYRFLRSCSFLFVMFQYMRLTRRVFVTSCNPYKFGQNPRIIWFSRSKMYNNNIYPVYSHIVGCGEGRVYADHITISNEVKRHLKPIVLEKWNVTNKNELHIFLFSMKKSVYPLSPVVWQWLHCF